LGSRIHVNLSNLRQFNLGQNKTSSFFLGTKV
jgi:hypothetical protein